MADGQKRASRELQRYRQFLARQSEVNWGPNYRAASRAVRGEVSSSDGADGVSGTLPAPVLGRVLNALSWPEKVGGAFALYGGAFEVHDQHVFYPSAKQHMLAYHPEWNSRAWPTTDGTFALSEQLGCAKWHPKAWDEATEQWLIGCWLGDFLVYRVDEAQDPYMLFWSVKQAASDQGRPGGAPLRRLSAKAIQRQQERGMVCAAYAEQLGSRIVDFNLNDVPKSLAATLVSLCRKQSSVIDLPSTAILELTQAFAEGVGTDEPARLISKRLLPRQEDREASKSVLEIAVWQRRVRVDLHQALLFDRPLQPERVDLLVEFADLFRK